MKEKEFLKLVEQHQGIIYKLVLLYATNAEEKKDLYQEIILQSWKSFESFRNDAKFSTWLYRICINTILTIKRKVDILDYKEDLTNYDTGYTQPTNLHQANSIQFAIKQLSETDRAIISMHLDGYENFEISETIGISNNHVAVKLHRIKQQLSNFLKNER